MKLKRALALCLVLLAVMAAAAWWLRRDIAVGLFNALAAEDGWRIVALEGLRAGLGGAGAERMVLEDGASGRRIELTALQADYRLGGLLSGNAVESLVVERLRVGPAIRQDLSPVQAIAIEEWLARLRSPPFSALRAEELFLPLWKIPLSLRAAVEGDSLRFSVEGGPWAAEGELFMEDLPRALLAFQRSGERQASLDLRLQRQGAGYRLEGSGRLDVPHVANLPVPLAAYSSIVAGGELEWEATLRLPADPRPLAPGDISLEIREGAVLRFAPGLLPDFEAPVLTLNAPLVLSFAGEFGAGMEVSTEAASLRLDSLRYGAYGMSGQFTLTEASYAGGASPRAALAFLSEGLHVGGLPHWLPAIDLGGELSLVQGEWAFQSTVHRADAREIVPLRASGSYSTAAGGEATLSLSPMLFSTASPLSAHFPGWPFPFDLAGGEVQAELRLAWDGDQAGLPKARLTGSLKDITGFHGEVFFQGLSGALQGGFAPAQPFPFSTPSLSWELERLNAGVDLTRLALDFRLEDSPPALAVDSFSAQLLGGELRSPGFVYEFGAASNALELAFHDIRLERVLGLTDYAGVEASGGVSGSLPIVVSDGRLSVEAGSFRSEAPGGVIRYSPARPQESTVNPGLSLVEQALSDYRFENIEGTLEYAPDGEIDIAMRIQGYNPQMNDGQRINLNLTLNDNLPVLLRSLQAGRSIEDMLEEEL